MKAFGKYISKYLLSFFVFALILLLVNIFAFALTFGGIVFREYGSAAPVNMLEAVAANLSYSESNTLKKLYDYSVVSLSYVINRSEPISEIDYKINSADNYSYHFKSDFVQKMGIKRKRMINLSAVPLWQREINAQKRIKNALDEYYSVSAVISGNCDLEIYDRVLINSDMFGEDNEFYVSELVFSKNENGESTSVLLKKKINGELVNYVA